MIVFTGGPTAGTEVLINVTASRAQSKPRLQAKRRQQQLLLAPLAQILNKTLNSLRYIYTIVALDSCFLTSVRILIARRHYCKEWEKKNQSVIMLLHHNKGLLTIVFVAALSVQDIDAAKRHGKKRTKPWDDPDRNSENDLLVTKKAFFDVEIDDEPAGRIVIALFGDTCPVTVQNFAALVRGNWRQDKRLSYNNTQVHRIVPDFVIQMGDVTEGDGTGGKSIYGEFFADENFYLRHWGPGWVAMANAGPDKNNSQFYILLTRARWLDGKHVVFGKVVEGMETVEKIAEIETDDVGFPLQPVRIIDCGIKAVPNPYHLPHPEKDAASTADDKK
ncbi:peptidyl-prolyl cis-trans isomerase B-like [Diadema setosum]|uniref:peptidyl-prolyl cis-trans isomerase B-like n=1 Tax=Diadema setosum TaxID=31175 RepID=UPI003B3BB96D